MHDVLPPGFILLAAVQLLQSVIGELNKQTQVVRAGTLLATLHVQSPISFS